MALMVAVGLFPLNVTGDSNLQVLVVNVSELDESVTSNDFTLKHIDPVTMNVTIDYNGGSSLPGGASMCTLTFVPDGVFPSDIKTADVILQINGVTSPTSPGYLAYSNLRMGGASLQIVTQGFSPTYTNLYNLVVIGGVDSSVLVSDFTVSANQPIPKDVFYDYIEDNIPVGTNTLVLNNRPDLTTDSNPGDSGNIKINFKTKGTRIKGTMTYFPRTGLPTL